MMMNRSNPTVTIPPFDCHLLEDPAAYIHSPAGGDFSHYDGALAALQRYLPANKDDVVPPYDCGGDADDFDVPVDAFSCDDFRMFEFKVRKCVLSRSHDWTACPYAHPGEKARRRDPRKFHYSGGACPDFRRGACRRGDACEYAHGVFECWLHPARYRTQPCKDGIHCRRRVCFFAHTAEQLRVLPYSAASPNASPSRLGYDSVFSSGLSGSSPRSTLYSPPSSSPTTGSPPVSPSEAMSLNSVGQLSESMRSLQLNKMKSSMGMGLSVSPPSWGLGIGSPRSPRTVRHGFVSLPSTPSRGRVGLSPFESWIPSCEEEPAMERVESGRELRERIYSKLGKENSLDRVEQVNSSNGSGQDFGWVSELVK